MLLQPHPLRVGGVHDDRHAAPRRLSVAHAHSVEVDEPLFQTALLPTLLDLFGVWDEARRRGLTEAMPDVPLTRRRRSTAPVVLTNVSWAWEYDEPNWRLMRGDLKLFATSRDARYRCFDLRRDPEERHDLALRPPATSRRGERPGWGWPR